MSHAAVCLAQLKLCARAFLATPFSASCRTLRSEHPSWREVKSYVDSLLSCVANGRLKMAAEPSRDKLFLAICRGRASPAPYGTQEGRRDFAESRVPPDANWERTPMTRRRQWAVHVICASTRFRTFSCTECLTYGARCGTVWTKPAAPLSEECWRTHTRLCGYLECTQGAKRKLRLSTVVISGA
jgi:hypothetical protein